MELATFLGVEIVREVRSKDTNNAARDVKELLGEVTHTVSDFSVRHFKFSGQGQRETPVGDLRTALYVAIVQRSRKISI